VSLNDINESKYPIHSSPLSDANTLAPQVLRCNGRRLQGVSVAGRLDRLYGLYQQRRRPIPRLQNGRLRPLLTALRE